MASSLSTKHIPTILGLLVLIGGLVGGILLANSSTIGFLPRASPETTPKNTKITNITDTSFTISWVTDAKTAGFIKYGTSPSNLPLTSTDDRDQVSGSTGSFYTHHVTVRNLSPSTTYYFKIGSSSSLLYDNNGSPYQTTTGTTITSNAKTIYGQVLNSQNSGVGGALVYISSDNLSPLSTLTQGSGSFVISLAQAREKANVRAADLAESLPLEILVVGADVQTTSTVKTTLALSQPLGDVILGKNQDFTNPVSTPSPIVEVIPQTEVASKFTAQLLAPATEIIATSSPSSYVTIESPIDGTTVSATRPTFSGTATKSAKLSLSIAGPTALSRSITANALGKWSYTATSSLQNGSYSLTVTSTTNSSDSATTSFEVAVPTPTPKTPAVLSSTESAEIVAGSKEVTLALLFGGILFIASGVMFIMYQAESKKLPY